MSLFMCTVYVMCTAKNGKRLAFTNIEKKEKKIGRNS